MTLPPVAVHAAVLWVHHHFTLGGAVTVDKGVLRDVVGAALAGMQPGLAMDDAAWQSIETRLVAEAPSAAGPRGALLGRPRSLEAVALTREALARRTRDKAAEAKGRGGAGGDDAARLPSGEELDARHEEAEANARRNRGGDGGDAAPATPPRRSAQPRPVTYEEPAPPPLPARRPATVAMGGMQMGGLAAALASAGETTVFGCTLAEAVARSQRDPGAPLPDIAAKCVAYLDGDMSLREVGLYRLCGSQREIKELKERFNAGEDVDLGQVADCNVVTGLFKLWMREMKDKPITLAAKTPAEVDALPEMRKALVLLLAKHLARVASRSDVNKMTVSNLAICWTPTLEMSEKLLRELIEREM